MGIHLFDWVENTVRKEEIARYKIVVLKHILQTVFKGLFLFSLTGVQSWHYVIKGEILYSNTVSVQKIISSLVVVSSKIKDLFLEGWLVDFPLTYYQMTNFRLFQTERVCRRQFQIWQKWQKVIQTGWKHCGKRRNCSLRAISPFPTVFSKGLFPRGFKRCHCVGMG